MSLRHSASSSSNHHYSGGSSSNLSGASNLGNVGGTPGSNPKLFGSRALRSETRAKAKDDIKRVMNAIERVRKWERRWISINDTTLKLYKWVPTSVLASSAASSSTTSATTTTSSNSTSASSSATEVTAGGATNAGGGAPTVVINGNPVEHQNGGGAQISPSKLNANSASSKMNAANQKVGQNDKCVLNLDENAQDSISVNKQENQLGNEKSNNNHHLNHHGSHHHHHPHHHHHLEENTNDNSQSSNSSLSLNTLPHMMPLGDMNALTDSESNQALLMSNNGTAGLLRGSSAQSGDSHLLKSNTNSQMDTEDDSMTK